MKVFILSNQGLDAFRQNVFRHILQTPELDIVGVGLNFRRQLSGWEKVKREWRKGRGGFVAVMVLRTLVRKLRITKTVSAEAFFQRAGIPTYRIRRLYQEDTYQIVCDSGAECIFLSGFGIIKEPVLSLVPKGILSYHHGDMRKYRGGPPALWELYNGESKIGVTVQKLEEGLDNGAVVAFREFDILPNESYTSLRRRIYEGSWDMAREALLKVARPDFKPEPLAHHELGICYTLPNLRQWLIFQGRQILRKLRIS